MNPDASFDLAYTWKFNNIATMKPFLWCKLPEAISTTLRASRRANLTDTSQQRCLHSRLFHTDPNGCPSWRKWHPQAEQLLFLQINFKQQPKMSKAITPSVSTRFRGKPPHEHPTLPGDAVSSPGGAGAGQGQGPCTVPHADVAIL